MKYRKKPVVIEAVQLRWDTWSEMCDHADAGSLEDGKPEGANDGEAIGLNIPTHEGLMHANENDWIIKSVHGELYPCKPDIFEATYELATQSDLLDRMAELIIDTELILGGIDTRYAERGRQLLTEYEEGKEG